MTNTCPCNNPDCDKFVDLHITDTKRTGDNVTCPNGCDKNHVCSKCKPDLVSTPSSNTEKPTVDEFNPHDYALTQQRPFDWKTSNLKGVELAKAILDSYKIVAPKDTEKPKCDCGFPMMAHKMGCAYATEVIEDIISSPKDTKKKCEHRNGYYEKSDNEFCLDCHDYYNPSPKDTSDWKEEERKAWLKHLGYLWLPDLEGDDIKIGYADYWLERMTLREQELLKNFRPESYEDILNDARAARDQEWKEGIKELLIKPNTHNLGHVKGECYHCGHNEALSDLLERMK